MGELLTKPEVMLWLVPPLDQLMAGKAPTDRDTSPWLQSVPVAVIVGSGSAFTCKLRQTVESQPLGRVMV